jgi:hypothetical protein
MKTYTVVTLAALLGAGAIWISISSKRGFGALMMGGSSI